MFTATSRSIPYPIALRTRWISTPVAAASGSTSESSPRSPLVRWWSMFTRTGHFRSSAPTRPVRSGEPQSSTTATSYSEPSPSKTTVSEPGRNSRFPGTGSAFSTVAVFPILRRARARASSEPMASPSGFSWQAMRNRSFSERTRQTADRSPLTGPLLPPRDPPEDLVDAGAAVVGVVVVELEVGGVPQVEHLPQLPAEEARAAPQGLCHGLPLLRPDEGGIVHVGDLQVGGDGDVGDGDGGEPGVPYLAQQEDGEFLPDPLPDARGAIAAPLHSGPPSAGKPSSPIASGRNHSMRRESSSTSPSLPIPSVMRSSIDCASREFVVTRATPIVPRCHRSWCATSATETGYEARIRAVRPERRRRLSFREPAPGKKSSAVRTATCTGTSPRSPRPGRRSGEGAGDLLDDVRLDLVADLDVVEVLDPQPALVPLEDLLDVVLEPLEGGEFPLVDHHAVPQQADIRVPGDLPRQDGAAGNRPDLGDVEGVPDLGPPLGGLLEGGLQHPLHRLLDVVHHVVDDRIEPDVDRFPLRELGGLGLRAHVEADDDGGGGGGEHHVRLRDPPHAGVDHVDLHLVAGELAEGELEGLHRPLHVGLDDDVEVLDLAGVDPLVQLLQAHAGPDDGPLPVLLPAVEGDLPGRALVLQNRELLPRVRQP